MNFKTFLSGLIICFIILACKSKAAFKYNGIIVNKEKKLAPAIDETENKVEKYFARLNYDSIVIVSKIMEDKVDAELQELKNLAAPAVPEGEDFKKAAINYFEFMKSIYTSYKNFGLQTTEEKRMAERQKILDLARHRENVLAEMQAAQRKYANANGFSLKKNE